MRTICYVMAFSLLLSGCKQIVMLKYGIHNPKEETPESLLSYMNKMEYPADNSYIFRDSVSFFANIQDSVFRKNMIGSLFFNDNGVMTIYKDTSKCQWSAGYFISQLDKDSVYHSDTSYTFQHLMTEIFPLSGADQTDTCHYDFTVLITWAKFLGKFNDRLFSVEEAVKQRPDLKLRLIFLNVDMQKSWRLTDQQKMLFKL